jgi:hypothetical protein
MGKMRNPFKSSVGKPERKRPLGRNKRGCKDNIKMHLKEIEWEEVG